MGIERRGKRTRNLMEHPSENGGIYRWSEILRCLLDGKNTHIASWTNTVSQRKIGNIEHLSPQSKVYISKTITKSPTHPLTMDGVGASKGFFKRDLGNLKFGAKFNSCEWWRNVCLFMLDWTRWLNNMSETFWNLPRSKQKEFDWRSVEIREIKDIETMFCDL